MDDFDFSEDECFEDYCCGTSFVGEVDIDVPCDECKGRGVVILLVSSVNCGKCKGTGRITK